MIVSILKIIGLILLVILCVILFLILLVLLVPVRYAAEFEYDKEHMRLDARMTWLAVFRFYAKLINKDFSYKLKVLFFKIMDSTAVPKEKNVKNNVRTEQEETVQPLNTKSEEAVRTQTAAEEAETGADVTEGILREEPKGAGEEPKEEEPKRTETRSRKPKKFRIPFHIMHPADIYDKIIRTLMDFTRKLDKICAQIVSEENRETVLFVLEQIKKLCRHIRPKKHGIYLKLGMKDPSLTGQIFGAYSVINSVWGLNFILEPDFDHEVLETKLYLKGRIRVINLLIIAIRLYSNKTLRTLIRRK